MEATKELLDSVTLLYWTPFVIVLSQKITLTCLAQCSIDDACWEFEKSGTTTRNLEFSVGVFVSEVLDNKGSHLFFSIQ